jgi:3-aminobutyryl-CoA ammonia-lyase
VTTPHITASLRVRMGEHDAHYAGSLVAGAKMMELFGDVATELLIRLDGDEGLFVAYDNVEFKAPVYAGDYLEARGEITRIGNTSRAMSFEVYKVIQLCRREGLAVSAAEVLDEPVLVCRATGTCVTPKPQQRLSPQIG